jgi:hypothetical protein
MSARSKLFAHEANAKPDMFFCLLKFNLKFLMPLWAVDRFIQILKIAKLGTRGGTYDKVRGPCSDQLPCPPLLTSVAQIPSGLEVKTLSRLKAILPTHLGDSRW